MIVFLYLDLYVSEYITAFYVSEFNIQIIL